MSDGTLTFDFDREKAIEAILYIAHNIPDPSYHSINKILYFADKTSLERYGRLICGDTYYAMKHGPVPGNTYDLMKEAPAGVDFSFRVENGRDIVPSRKPDLDELSDSDIECLDLIIHLYGNVPFWKRTEDSHDEAWRQAWESRGERSSNVMTVESIVSLLDDAEELLEHLRTRHNDRAS
jgi:uncharacterized phage-associated protein